MTAPLPTLHPLEEVAAQLRVAPRTLAKRARLREFEHVQIGRERYLTDEQLQKLLTTSTVTAKVDEDRAAVRDRVVRQRSRKRPAA